MNLPMSDDISKAEKEIRAMNDYNKHFFDSFCGEDYSNVEYWSTYFSAIADKIVEYFSPKTLLDAGCANGYLVAELRKRGVEAYGVDISTYAIESASEEIRPYLHIQSLTDPLPEHFPKRYDMVVTIEVLEHLFPEDGAKAIAMLCSYSDTVLFSSTPYDLENASHFNVQQQEYWAKIFAGQSFFRNHYQPTEFLTPWTMLFQKETDIPSVIFRYELTERVEKANAQKGEKRDGTVYFDTGAGFNEGEKTTFVYYGEDVETGRIAVPAGCRSVRIDPVEDAFTVLVSPTVVTNCGIEKTIGSNATMQIGETYYFENSDPQFYLSTEGRPVCWVEFGIRMAVCNDQKDFKAVSALVEKALGDQAEVSAVKGALAAAEAQNAALAERHRDDAKELEIANRGREDLKAEKEVLAEQLQNSLLAQKMIERKLEETEAARVELEAVRHDEQRQLSEARETIQKSESEISDLKSECEVLKTELQECKDRLEDAKWYRNAAEDEKASMQTKIDYLDLHYRTAINQRTALQAEVAELRLMYDIISTSASWRMTKPLRVTLDLIKKVFKKLVPGKIKKFFRSWREVGLRKTIRKVKNKLKHRQDYSNARQPFYTAEALEEQRHAVFARDIRFSVLVPLYNTPREFLKEMIQSVLDQTYSNWELCLADGSDEKHAYVQDICEKTVANDGRVKYRKLEKNLGISGNTNACIEISSGDYIALFDHDDLLHPAALYEVACAIRDKGADFIYTDENTFHKTPRDAYCPNYKPDFSPDLLRSYNYICHLTVFSRELMNRVGTFQSEYDGSQDYDMILRLTEKAAKIVHIPKILYYWRASAQSTAMDISAKPYTMVAAKKALAAHLARIGLEGSVTDSSIPSTYRITYPIHGNPLVSILIPNMDHIDSLSKCITSVEELSTYKNVEIIVIENNSKKEETFEYYEFICRKYSNVRVIKWEREFNYSAINNFGIRAVNGEYCILLNNDIEILTPSWIEEMLMFVQRKDVGAAGMMLYYPDDTIQHAGVILGIGGVAGHSHKYFKRGSYGYMSRLTIAQDLSAVTAASMMVKTSVLKEVGGLDESFAVAFNDVDLCMKIRKAGYLIVFTPYAEAYHYESKSRGAENTPEKVARFNREIDRFNEKWGKELAAGDPYYNPNLTLEREDFSMK